jgi:hypothetical protein
MRKISVRSSLRPSLTNGQREDAADGFVGGGGAGDEARIHIQVPGYRWVFIRNCLEITLAITQIQKSWSWMTL